VLESPFDDAGLAGLVERFVGKGPAAADAPHGSPRGAGFDDEQIVRHLDRLMGGPQPDEPR